ncbi:hypothetical protein [Pleurocapsa sp. FMAR1]|uniref:hypothetical protein n=1 Tax=Pleurocapsa sp. FMAR1 TaxID=3040204 RepID=UPI0029C72486|nr:hypothetical protein [Pleurocapsa sp. FMAR1]
MPSCIQKQRINGKIGDEICDRAQELRKTLKGKDALVRILFKTTRLLYRELLSQIKS